MEKELERYLHLRYPMEIVEAEEGGYFAQLPDLPGCMAQGEAVEEAVKNLEAAKRAWIEVRLEDGLEVPPPHEVVEEYSGRFLMRVPKSLHHELAQRARREGTSLNQYVLHLLSLALGREREEERAVDLVKQLASFSQRASAFGYFVRSLARGRPAWRADVEDVLAPLSNDPRARVYSAVTSGFSNVPSVGLLQGTTWLWGGQEEAVEEEREPWILRDELFPELSNVVWYSGLRREGKR